MIDTYWRQPYQVYFADPAASLLGRTKTPPLLLTFLSLTAGMAASFCIATGFKAVPLVLLLLSGCFDTLDGTLARSLGKTSPQGAAWDIFADRVVEFSVVLGLYLYSPIERGLICMLMLGSVLFCVTSFLVVGIFEQNTSAKSFHYSPGMMERTEAFLFFIAMILLPAWFIPLGLLFALLTTVTGAIRMLQFQNHMHND